MSGQRGFTLASTNTSVELSELSELSELGAGIATSCLAADASGAIVSPKGL